MERNDQWRYRNRDQQRRYPENPESRWEGEGGAPRSDENRRWTEGDQPSWQSRDQGFGQSRDQGFGQSRDQGSWQSRDQYSGQGRDQGRDRQQDWRNQDERWRSQESRSGFDDQRRQGSGDWQARYYPSSGTYGGSSSYNPSYQGSSSYRGERTDRDYRGSYDDSPAIYHESRPGSRPYQQASGQAGQDRYRYEEQIRRGGRPPRTYKRSDERVHDEICELVARESDIDAGEVDVRVENGEVTFTGTVEDRRSKRELEDIAERVFGVVDIHNNLKVRKTLLNELGEKIFGTTPDENQSRTNVSTKSQTGQKM